MVTFEIHGVIAVVHTMGTAQLFLSQVCFMIIDISVFFFFFPSIKALEGFNDKNDRETYASPLMNASLFHFRSMAVFGF